MFKLEKTKWSVALGHVRGFGSERSTDLLCLSLPPKDKKSQNLSSLFFTFCDLKDYT